MLNKYFKGKRKENDSPKYPKGNASMSKKLKFQTNAQIEDHHYDTIVIGAGIVGSAIGLTMARAGKKTLILEKVI